MFVAFKTKVMKKQEVWKPMIDKRDVFLIFTGKVKWKVSQEKNFFSNYALFGLRVIRPDPFAPPRTLRIKLPQLAAVLIKDA